MKSKSPALTPPLETMASDTDGQLLVADANGGIDIAQAVSVLRRDAGSGPGEWLVRRVRSTAVAPIAALAFAVLLVEGLRRRYQLTVAETSHQDKWQRAEIAFAAVGSSPGHVTEVIDEAERFVWSFPALQVLDSDRRWVEMDS